MAQKVLTTSSGALIAMPSASDLGHGSELFGATSDRYVMAYLKPIVTGLGGKATMDNASDKMSVTLPAVGK